MLKFALNDKTDKTDKTDKIFPLQQFVCFMRLGAVLCVLYNRFVVP